MHLHTTTFPNNAAPEVHKNSPLSGSKNLTSKTIDRIAPPTRDVFYKEYVLRRKPVVITGLFKGQEIGEVRDEMDARKVFGNTRIIITQEYSRSAASPVKTPDEVLDLSSYLDYVMANPGTSRMCTEYDTPIRVSSTYRVPDLCKMTHQGLIENELLDLPRRWGDHDLMSNLFIGNRGNYAHLHYDGDHRHVLLYQVFGTKRAILIDPEKGNYLDLLNSIGPGFSNVYIENKSEDEKLRFVEEIGAYDTILKPGEALYIPMLMWHYLEYVDLGMSINFRFMRNKYGRFLSVDNFHRDFFGQNLSSKMVSEEKATENYFESLEYIKRSLLRKSDSRRAKIVEMRNVFREVCSEICPECEPALHCDGEHEGTEIDKIEQDISESGVYLRDYPVPQISHGPLSSSQQGALIARFASLRYPARAVEAAVYNRFAKETLSDLTKAEAASLLRALTSPGAMWE